MHLLAAYLAISAAGFEGLPPAAGAAVLALVGLVTGLELVNSAVERAVDRMGRERHPLSRDAKDLAAGAVLAAAVAAAAAGVWLLGAGLGRGLHRLLAAPAVLQAPWWAGLAAVLAGVVWRGDPRSEDDRGRGGSGADPGASPGDPSREGGTGGGRGSS